MIKLPLFLNGALVDNGRKMTKAEAVKLIKAAHGEAAKAVQTEGMNGTVYSKEWRAIH